jgi:hypothetical protein
MSTRSSSTLRLKSLKNIFVRIIVFSSAWFCHMGEPRHYYHRSLSMNSDQRTSYASMTPRFEPMQADQTSRFIRRSQFTEQPVLLCSLGSIAASALLMYYSLSFSKGNSHSCGDRSSWRFFLKPIE